MARPALSAERSLDVLDILAAFPNRGFSLSEIARLAKINSASCHAILNVLVSKGYLKRGSNGRSFLLGPALVAIGRAALKSQPLVISAEPVVEELAQELGVPVLLNTLAGDDILCVLSHPAPSGRYAGMEVGERLPLVAPAGAPFMAWSTEEQIEQWIARAALPHRAELAEGWRHMLALTRQRGFQVTLRMNDGTTISAMMSEMASRRGTINYKDEVARYVNSLDGHFIQPETIEPERAYEIVVIASPLFDQKGTVAYNLCLTGFPDQLSGATILNYADRLVGACVRIMRDNRAKA